MPLLLFLCLSFLLYVQAFSQTTDFKTEQLKNKRVQLAYEKKEKIIQKYLTDKKLDIYSLQIFVRVFKQEKMLEVWAKDKNHTQFSLLKSYKICYESGSLGPKRKEGDLQVPEGFYDIAGFNPNGTYYLTLWVNYPNASDRMLGKKDAPGGDICIHGKCVSIGCMPMTDNQIEEIYLLCTEARNAGQTRIPTHIFPTRLEGETYEQLKTDYANMPELLRFWQNLQPGFAFFEKNHTLPDVKVDKTGKYLVNNGLTE
jgi:murein L,D-transpeptidase YafK